MSVVPSLTRVNRTWRGELDAVEIDPGCVKTFFRPENCTQPGTIRVDTTV